MTISSDDRLRITYRLALTEHGDPAAAAEDIALEQSVELPGRCLESDAERIMVGRVEHVARGEGEWSQAVISFPGALIGTDLLQLLNVIFGNISLKRGMLVTAVELPGFMVGGTWGPRFGIAGVRNMLGVEPRTPLLCAALKPVGLRPDEVARRCYEFAAAGVHIVKDDHGFTDQVTAGFRERVERCLDAVERANRAHDEHSIYFPNVTGSISELPERLEFLRAAGCRGVLLSPLLVGLDTVRSISDQAHFAILAHPAMAGAYFGATHGIRPDVLLGTIFRLAGSDGVIYPNVGGRFALSADDCTGINHRLREPLSAVRPAFPVPGGGIAVERVPEWVRRYGPDTIFLIGASLYDQPDVGRAARELVMALTRGAMAAPE